jgi:hypothetical protein
MNPQFVQYGPGGQSGYYDNNKQFIPMDKATFDTQFASMVQGANPFLPTATDNYTMAGTTTPSSMNSMSMPQMPYKMEAIDIAPINLQQSGFQIPKVETGNTGPFKLGPMPTADMPIQKGIKLTDRQKGSLIGAGANLVSKGIRTLAPDTYNQRVGMENPNAVGTILGDTTMTQLGSSIMPGIGTAIGGGLDLIKNIFTYGKKKAAYDAGVRKANFSDYRDNLVSNREQDYTGLARHGIKAKNPYLRNYGKFSGKMKKR